MPTPKRRTRPCEACRDRHLKCHVEGEETSCMNCKSEGVECNRAAKRVKFKSTKKVKSAHGFLRDQPWVKTGARLRFQDETNMIAALLEEPSSSQGPSLSQDPARHLLPSVEPATIPIGLQEACLIRHFTAKLAQSFDATDRDAHYALTVPHRALTSPVLLYAICTVSSRLLTSRWYRTHPKPTVVHHDNIPLPALDEHSAIHYHNACLRLLMTFADIPADEANAEARADALAATTMLRTYEQLDTSLTGLDAEVYQSVVSTVMSKHHSPSIYSLLNMDKNNRDPRGMLIPAEGLRTSACLVALRQEIWSVVMYRRPLRLPLAGGMDYGSLRPADDFTWANRVMLWCADVLRFCFGAAGNAEGSVGAWAALRVFDERWTEDMPRCFCPLFYRPANPERGEVFPTIWLVNRAHVTAVQHLHLGRMLLALYDPRHAHAHFVLNPNTTAKQQVCDSVKAMCGLALSDTQFQSGMTTAAIGISVGGAFLDDPQDQRAIEALLLTLEEDHAWPTRSIVAALQQAWGADCTLGSGTFARGAV